MLHAKSIFNKGNCLLQLFWRSSNPITFVLIVLLLFYEAIFIPKNICLEVSTFNASHSSIICVKILLVSFLSLALPTLAITLWTITIHCLLLFLYRHSTNNIKFVIIIKWWRHLSWRSNCLRHSIKSINSFRRLYRPLSSYLN